jgi:DNA-binding response OmpR family regulator
MPLVLLVEDDPDLRTLLLESLSFFGHFAVIGVADGISGLAQCVTLVPDCLVVDVKLPGLDGYQIIRAIRGDARTAAIPVIVLTALFAEHARFVGLASGADRFLQKPITAQALAAVIDEVMQLEPLHHVQQMQNLLGESG